MREHSHDPLREADRDGIPQLEGRSHDPLREAYRSGITEPAGVLAAIKPSELALVCIDMQHLDAVRGHGVFADPDHR